MNSSLATRAAVPAIGRSLLLLGLLCGSMLVSTQSRAECGGDTNCIAVSTDPTKAPFHSDDGVNRPAPTMDFGTQASASTSAARTILVAGVEGTPAGSRATLNSITLSGPTASDFTITGGTRTVAIRMPKVKQKISGCFRTFTGAQNFCMIRSYLDTMHKQVHNLFEVLRLTFMGCPPSPDLL